MSKPRRCLWRRHGETNAQLGGLAGNRARQRRDTRSDQDRPTKCTELARFAGSDAAEEDTMQLYAGLDVSMDETSICVVDRDGKIIKECKADTEPAAIRSALEGYADRLHRVGLEAQAFSPWLFNELSAMGFPAIVVEAVHMQKALSAQRNKTDRNDARGIAHMMRVGWFRQVHVKSSESQHLRVLLSNRRLL